MAVRNFGMDQAIGGIPAIDPRWDRRFRQLTSLGNAAFDAGEDAQANAHYRAAMEEAERLFDTACHDDSAILIAPMALTIAAHNLATAMGRAGTAEAARAVSIEVAERLIATAEAVDRPIALRLNCLRHLRHALAFAAEFQRGSGLPVRARLAERAASVTPEVMRVADFWHRTETASAPQCASLPRTLS